MWVKSFEIRMTITFTACTFFFHQTNAVLISQRKQDSRNVKKDIELLASRRNYFVQLLFLRFKRIRFALDFRIECKNSPCMLQCAMHFNGAMCTECPIQAYISKWKAKISGINTATSIGLQIRELCYILTEWENVDGGLC